MNARYKSEYPLELADRMDNYTGAEVEKWVISAIYDGEEDAFANARPIYNQSRQQIEKCREWAKSNARLANATPATEASGRKLKI
jgi:hypothetical protein